jgi:hypothetical protein
MTTKRKPREWHLVLDENGRPMWSCKPEEAKDYKNEVVLVREVLPEEDDDD